MARTALTVSELSPNAAVAQPAGTAGNADGHSVAGVAPEELVLRVVIANAETDVTVVAGDNPPSLSAGQGSLVSALGVGSHLIGPFTSARFKQSDGTVHVDVETAANVTITALHVPRTA